MPKTPMALELGIGSSLRRKDYTAAGLRAVENALWRNSLNLAQAFDVPREAMIVDVAIAVQEPAAVDLEKIAACFPYGTIEARAEHGGLDVPKPDGSGVTVIANAAITVSFDVEPVQ